MRSSAGQPSIASAAGSVAEQELAVVPILWWLGPIGSIFALVFAYLFYRSVMEVDEGTPRMIEIAQAVRDGASAYLNSQYRVVAIVFAILFVIFLTTLAPAGFAQAQQNPPEVPTTPKPESTAFSRWIETGETEGRFETAIVTYEDAKGRRVDLIGAVHIGDTRYYKLLQKQFTTYDALLYELVLLEGILHGIRGC